jgi:AcrR family transcriptional regulator
VTAPDDRRTTDTHERLLEIAEASVLSRGFGATSIDALAAEAGISKNGFFYHFPDKNALARALLERYLARDEAVLDDVFARGRVLSDDPLHAFLIGLKLLAETMADLPQGHPGCLVATYCYQERLFDREVHELNREIVLRWRARFRAILDTIRARYEPRADVNLTALADMASAVVEGGLVLGRATGNTMILPEQIMLFRSYIALLFQPELREAG